MNRPIEDEIFDKLEFQENAIIMLESAKEYRKIIDNIKELRKRGFSHTKIANLYGITRMELVYLLKDEEEIKEQK